jgi:hypothetical protein
MCALRANERLPCLPPECTAAAGPTLRGIPPGTVSNGVCYLRALTAEDRPHCRHRRSCSCLVGTTPGTLHARTTRRSGLPLSTHMGLLGVSANMGHSVHSAGATQTTQIGGTHTRVLVYEYYAGTGALTWALQVLTEGTRSTHVDAVNGRIRYSEYFHAVLRAPRMGSHPGVRSTTWCPAWGTRSVHMALTLARPAQEHTALTRACEERACACTRAHECALRAATVSQRRITCAALSSELRIRRRHEV